MPYGYWGSRRFDGVHAEALHQRLSSAIKPRLAAQVIAGFHQQNFVRRIWTQDKGTAQIRCVLLAHDGPLWKDARKELLAAIQDAGGNQTIQDNIYDLLYWFDHGFSEGAQTGDAESLKQLFQDKELLAALWAAATARPLSPYSTIKLNNFVMSLKKINITVALPSWWEYTIKQIELPKALHQPPENDTNQTA